MSCRTETVGLTSYNYCPDDMPTMADRKRSIMKGYFFDELTGKKITSQLKVLTDDALVVPLVSSNSVAGLVANPVRRFPHLLTNKVEVNVSISANRYLPQSFKGTLGPINTATGSPADFPDYFAPADLGNIGLHREASTLTGRCVQNTVDGRVPLVGVNVELSGMWHQFPAANIDPFTAIETTIISLQQRLYRQRNVGVDQVRQRELIPALGEEKTLVLPVAVGDTQVRISDRVNLVTGNVLAIDLNHNDLVEYIEVTDVEDASPAEQPATVTLAYPLVNEHHEGITIIRVEPQLPATSVNLVRDGVPQDQTLFLNALTDMAGSTIEIFGADSPEYHTVHSTVMETTIISLLQGLYRQRNVGVDQIRQRELIPALGEEKTLVLPVAVGDTHLRISDRVNLVTGSVLAIDLNHNDLVEYIEVTDVEGATTAEQPATVTLAYPLINKHHKGTTVIRVQPQLLATSVNLVRDGIPGDQTLFLNVLTDITDSTIEIFGTGSPEYHKVRLYKVQSDTEGYFRLPPISRVAMTQLLASRADLAQPVNIILSPNYELFENHFDLIFS